MAFLAALLCQTINAWSQKKIALLAGIGNYEDSRSWKSLSSPNDLKYLNEALLQQGFITENIYTLQEEAATHMAILNALVDLADKSKMGDIVYFHFSGHGQQIEDDNGDEADGYDEALVPYDARGKYDPVNYDGKNHLRDDALGQKLENIRKKIGPSGSLLVMLDACHSGTATRGNEFAICRGTPTPFQSPTYKPKSVIDLADRAKYEEGFLQNSASNMVVISAASPNQVNYETKDPEGQGVGSLSIAFAKAMGELEKGSNYRYLFEKIKSKIQSDFPMQIPMIEGNTSQAIFEGKYVPQSELITINEWLSDSTFSINQGELHGLNTGTSFTIHSLSGNQIMAEGLIAAAGSFRSICQIKKKLDKKEAYKIVVNEVKSGSFHASLFIKLPDNKSRPAVELSNQVQRMIRPYQYLSLSNNADFMLDIQPLPKGSHSISLIEKGDSILWHADIKNGDTLSAEAWQDLLKEIKLTMRVKYIRNIPDGGSLAEGVTVEIIPENSQPNKNEIIFHPLDFFTLKVVNNSPNDLYYTILDLLPGNDVQVIIPDKASQPIEFMIKSKGQPLVIPKIQVEDNSAEGKEMLKIFFSKQPIELRNIFNRTKTRGNGNMQSIEEVMNDMFKDEYSQHPTRSDMGAMKLNEIGIATVGFTIRKQ
jgi:hypothetical protein